MTIWAWVQPVERIWKVVTDSEKGKINIYNEKGELIMEENGLTPEAVALIEEHFLEIVATRLTERDRKIGNISGSILGGTVDVKRSEYNPMYV